MNVTNLKLNANSRLVAGLLISGLSACGSKSTIDLQTPPAPQAPARAPNGKASPSSPANPNDPNTNPEKPDQPVHSGPVPNRYRLICEGPLRVAPFVSFESTSKSFEGSFILFLGSYADPSEAVTRDHKNIVEGNLPIAIPGAGLDQAEFLFVGRKQVSKDTASELRLFQVTVDSVLRTGKAVDLGAATVTDKSLRQAADQAGLAAANYGSSDQGNYLLIPALGGFTVMSRDRARTFGLIKADVTKTILPKIFESQKVFTALVFNGRAFTPVLQKIEFAGSAITVSKASNVGAVSGSALPLQVYNSTSLTWSEAAVGGANSITIAKVDTSTNRVTRATYRTPVPNAKIYPGMAVTAESADPAAAPVISLNVAVEALTYNPTNEKTGADVAYAKVQKLILNSAGTSLSEGDAIDYPATALAKVQSLGLANKWIIQSLFSTENADELLGTFDARNGFQIYKDRGGYFDGVTETACGHPAVVQEVQ
jgi:hypothetical protein